MGLEDNVAVTALVVSLIALLITLGQTLQQYFATASGYNRCAPAVLGSWANLRHRRPIWWEFRFETNYTAPHITIEAHSEVDSNDRGVLLVDFVGCRQKPGVSARQYAALRESVHPHRKSDNHHPGKRTRETDGSQGELLASWLALLCQSHNLYHGYWPGSRSTCCANAPAPPRSSAPLPISPLPRHPKVTSPMIAFKTWTWDFMPTDLIKPLATSTVSDMVLLALRMGMKWHALDPGKGLMTADGNGLSLQVIDTRGLGVVLQFGVNHPPEHFPLNVPSQAADKMMFGIVPGDPTFVRRDYPTVPDTLMPGGTFSDKGPAENILESIGVPGTTASRARASEHRRLHHNELVALLCPFMALEDCSVVSLGSPLFAYNRISVFLYWEGRLALVRGLAPRVVSSSGTIKHVYESLQKLMQEYPNDFFVRWGRTAIESKGIEQTKMINYCRGIYNTTTDYFTSHKFDSVVSNDKEGSGQTLYMRLIAAHLTMSVGAIAEAMQKLKQDRAQKGVSSQADLQLKYGLPQHKYDYFVEEVFILAAKYVEHIHHKDHGVVKYMQDEGFNLSAEKIEEAWWVLVLRGIVWNMCIRGRGMTDTAVPSSLYTNKTPVWII